LREAITDMPPISTWTPSTQIARRAALLATGGLATYGLCMWLAGPTLGVPRPRIATVFGAIVLLNFVLALTAESWAHQRSAGYVFGVGLQVLVTAVLYVSGGIGASFLVFVYLFPIFHTAMIGPTSAIFVTANAGVLLYGALVALEMNGLMPPAGTLRWDIDATQGAAIVGICLGGFNFFAVYATSYGIELRRSTERLQREVAKQTRALTAANAELARRAQALEASQHELRTLVYAVTHDVKNPINSIMLIADLLRERDGDAFGPAARDELDRIVRLAGSTENMIRDLFELFQIAAAREDPAWFELGPAVSEVLATLQPQLDRKHASVVVGPLPRAWGCPRKIGNLLANLLGNATKYVPEGGGRIEVRALTEDGAVHLTVRDNGPGIPEGYHQGIFELFARVPDDEQDESARGQTGTGVGLAIVKRIVDAHEGRVWVESRPGEGTTFHVRLPLPSTVTA
jgi:signal transduction histidine kinase